MTTIAATSDAMAANRVPLSLFIDRGFIDRGESLVDLKGFEPLTSSMPFKRYQSLTGKNTRNTRLSVTRFGRRWTPPDAVFTIWTPHGLRDSTQKTARRVPSRARLPRRFDCCLLETTTEKLPYKENGAH